MLLFFFLNLKGEMMDEIKVIIIDDERLAREIVKNYLNEHEEVEIAAECQNGLEGVKAIAEFKPDIIFLDIQMPKITGFEMLELIDEKPVIIFTTAYDQYAINAFEVNATDYLLKPFAYDRFDEALNKAFEKIKLKQTDETAIKKIIEHNESNDEILDRIIIKNNQKIEILPVDELLYLEAQDDYVQVVTQKGKFLKQKTLKYFEEHLNPSDFIRVHRGYIVSIDKIKRLELFEKETHKLHLSDGSKIPVSKSGYGKLKEILK